MDKILIIKTSALGDVVQVYPVISYLRSKFPQAKIDWIVESQCVDLVQNLPEINRTISVSTKHWRKNIFKRKTWKEIFEFNQQLRSVRYDCVFDLQGNTKSGLILAQVRSSLKVGFGCSSVPEIPNLLFTNKRFNPPASENIRIDYLSIVSQALGDRPLKDFDPIKLHISEEQSKTIQNVLTSLKKSHRPLVLVCPGSAWKNKQMTPESLCDFLLKVNVQLMAQFIFSWGSLGEKLIAENLQSKFPCDSIVIEKMSLATLQNLMDGCDLVIAMDSLPLHLAGSTKTPTYSIFGASSAQKYKPIGKVHGSYQGLCPYGKKFEKRCPVLRTCTTGACIRNLDGNEVFSHFYSWWKQLYL